MKKDSNVYLEDIIESISHIEDYIKGVSQERFEEDILLQNAVIRRFQIIGEAVKRISGRV